MVVSGGDGNGWNVRNGLKVWEGGYNIYIFENQQKDPTYGRH